MNMYQKREERKKKRLEAEGQDNIRPSISISWDRRIYVPIA